MNATREPGHYWVKVENEFEPAYFDVNGNWFVIGRGVAFYDTELHEIDETPITRQSTKTATPDPSEQLMSEITTEDLEQAVKEGMFRQRGVVTDEEIERAAKDRSEVYTSQSWFRIGAKWMRSKLLTP